jgi:MOSC domain-containing protein YiiM
MTNESVPDRVMRSDLATAGTISALFAGPVRTLRSPRAPGGDATTWKSAILRASIDGSVTIGRLGLANDQQKERKHHGGPTKAVLIYAAAHYPDWADSLGAHAAAHAAELRAMSAEIDASRFGWGAFGENITIDGIDERSVCLGDIWQIGDATLQITEPRAPCATLARRWLRPTLIDEVNANARAGWYNAVLREGAASTGADATLLERVTDVWTVERVFYLLHRRVVSRNDVIALHDAPCTNDALRARLSRRLETPGRTRD